MVRIPGDCSTEEKDQRKLSSQNLGSESDGSVDEAQIGSFHTNCSILFLNAVCVVTVILNDMCVQMMCRSPLFFPVG